jgi:hypothetical protein
VTLKGVEPARLSAIAPIDQTIVAGARSNGDDRAQVTI